MLRIFKKLRKQDWLYIAISVVFIFAQVCLDLKMPDYMSEITQLVQTLGNEMQEVFRAGGKMLICALGSLLSAVVVSILCARVSMSDTDIQKHITVYDDLIPSIACHWGPNAFGYIYVKNKIETE